MNETSYFFSIHQENTCNSSLHLNLIILTDFHSFTVNEDKLQKLVDLKILLRSEYAIQVKIWKWLNLLNFVPFIKKTLVNQVYIRIWSFWMIFTFTVNEEKLSKYREIHYNIYGNKKMGVNRLNPVHKATYLKSNQKWEKMKNVQ